MPQISEHALLRPEIHTPRLTLRPLRPDDLADCIRLYDDIGWNDPDHSAEEATARRRSWLAWSVDNQRELARLFQPPYGERAVVDRETGAFVGLVGLVPSLVPLGQLPSFGAVAGAPHQPEVGLFWAISPARQHKGVATEAAGALMRHAFATLCLARIVATTEHDNLASAAVMRRIGMTVETNPFPEPRYFQTMGWLDAGARS
ncbi:MAG TPA: GNAT family N-acetyltransferase [Caulobacteraceae bacterium]|nr:GNAT family N-acetyltransferase [Caulobacteraceae bacterium]